WHRARLLVLMLRSFTKTKRKKSVLEERFGERARSKAPCDNSPVRAGRSTEFGAAPSRRFRYRPRAAGLGFSYNFRGHLFGCMRPADHHLVRRGYVDRDGHREQKCTGDGGAQGNNQAQLKATAACGGQGFRPSWVANAGIAGRFAESHVPSFGRRRRRCYKSVRRDSRSARTSAGA